MSLEGRINVDCLFHDKDGTASLKVVSLQRSEAYTSGKVAVLNGTMTTAGATITSATGYKDAAGDEVRFSEINRVAFQSSRDAVVIDDAAFCKVRSRTGLVGIGEFRVGDGESLTISRTSAVTWPSGTASYTLVLYGT